jgi:outer membrane cobalamin receptor
MMWRSVFAALAMTATLSVSALADGSGAEDATSPGKSGRLAEVLVTATRHEAQVDSVPNAVTVITREQIDQMVAPTTIDILKNVPGVEVYNARGPLSSSTFNRVFMRGQGSNPARNLIMVNGVPQVQGESSDFEWSFINPRDIERIEVVRGPGSALYGSQAMGGVINIITRRPTEKDGKTTLEAKYGSMDTVTGAASYSRKVDDWGFFGSVAGGGTDGYSVIPGDQKKLVAGQEVNSRNMRSRNDFGRGMVTYDPDSTSSLTLSYMHGHFVNRGTYDYMPDFLLFNMEREAGDIRYVKKFQGAEFTAWGSTAYQASNYQNANTTTYKSVTGTAPSIQRDFQGGTSLGYDVGLGNYVSLGLDAKHAAYDRRYDNGGTTGDTYGSTGGDSTVYGAFLQDELKLFDGKVVITPGTRYEYTSMTDGYYELRSAGISRRDVADEIFRSLTSRIGARYNALSWLSLRSAYGESFRAPTLSELYGMSKIGTSSYYGNSDLKPEHLKSIEGGVDITPLDNLRFSATVYKNHATDYIDNVLVSTGPNVYNKKNIGTVDTAGIETELEYTFLDFWRAFVNYQRCDPKLMNGNYVGQRVTGTPLSTTSFGLSFNDPKLFSLSVVDRRVGKIWYNSQNTVAYGNYDVVDVKLAKAFELTASKLELSLEVSNLFDVQIRETASTQAPGSTITAGVTWIF